MEYLLRTYNSEPQQHIKLT